MNRFIILPLLLFSISQVWAGEDVAAQVKELQSQVERLVQAVGDQGKTIQSQQKKIDEQQQMLKTVSSVKAPIAGGADPDLFKRIERAEQQSAYAIKIAGRKKPNELNMSIGAAIDTSFGVFDGLKQDAAIATGRAAGDDFAVRGAEVVFYADVDPYFKTYMVLNSTPDPTANDEAKPSLEEAAIATTSLSHVQIKGGRFFMPFGRLDMIHDHDLPFTTRPPSLDNYIGGESAGDGVQVTALLPIEHFVQVTGGAFNKLGATFPLVNTVGDRRDTSELTYFARVLTTFDFCEDHTAELGVSTAQVPNNEHRRDLSNLEFTYKWHPPGTTMKQRLVWGTEVMRNHLRSELDITDPTDGTTVRRFPIKRGFGGYSYVEWFLTRHWSVGPRVDLFENVDPTIVSKRTYDQSYTAFLTYNFSEFSRLRFECDRRYFFDGHRADEFFLQWTVFWGAHVHGFEQR